MKIQKSFPHDSESGGFGEVDVGSDSGSDNY